ncbi:MAG: acetyltransferase [Myxococcaceae bacterium]|nr:acetyltransferase [Myxococcaceae bacterium]
MGFTIRLIHRDDDPTVATIIRTVMPEFGADGPGFAIHDAEVDAMHDAYAAPKHAYFVVTRGEGNHERVVGGGGIAPLIGGDGATCELRKMYFLPEARGTGAGAALLAHCLDIARAGGFERCYLETLTGMDAAQRLYEKFGFQRLAAPLGATGHTSCNRWYLLSL